MRALGAAESRTPGQLKLRDIKSVPGWRWHVAFMALVMGCPPGSVLAGASSSAAGQHPSSGIASISPETRAPELKPAPVLVSPAAPDLSTPSQSNATYRIARESISPSLTSPPADLSPEGNAEEAGWEDADGAEIAAVPGASAAHRNLPERKDETPAAVPAMIDLTAETLPNTPLTQMPTGPRGQSIAMKVSVKDAFSLEPFTGVVLKVVDGDTYHLDNGTKIRLSGVNTPEKSEKIGQKVKKEVTAFLLGKTITVYPVTRDHYGRVVGDVRLDGQSVTQTLIANGWAHVYLIPPSQPENLQALLLAQKEAREAKKGIWGEERYRGPLHITSFHANARGEDAKNLSGEYVRIANTSGTELNLAGFTLTSMHGQTLTLPALTVPAGYTFQVISGKGEASGSTTEPYKIFWNGEGPVWNDEQEQATLRDPSGKWLDAAEHGMSRRH